MNNPRPKPSVSVLFQIGGLVLASIAAVLLITFAVVALTPPPQAPRMNLAEVRQALLSPAGADRAGLKRSIHQRPPLETPSGADRVLAETLAYGLGVSAQDVRVRLSKDQVPPARTVLVTAEKGADIQVAIDDPPKVPNEDEALKRLLLLREFPQPAFEAAVRQKDGTWLLVEAETAWLSVWRLRLLLAFAFSALLLGPAAWIAARRLTRPIRDLAGLAREAGLRLEALQPIAGPREIEAAAAAIVDMHTRLRQEAEQRARMLAAVAHDLRTPLTGLRLRAETAPPDERDRMAADIARMDDMISKVIAYTAEEHGNEVAETFDLAKLVDDSVKDAVARGLDVSFVPPDPLHYRGGRSSLQRALTNLLDNAARYAGKAEVSLKEGSGSVVLAVEDRGPGIAEDLLAKVLDPFVRGEPSRNLETGGSGLGLAIARSVARQHGGDLGLTNRTGGGLRAELRLPVRSSA